MEALRSQTKGGMATWYYRQMVFMIVLACGPTGVGCGDAQPTTTPTAKRLRALATAYLDYAAARGCGPADQRQLTRHLQSMPAFALGLSDTSAKALGQLYLSPRDQMPFAIQYGQAISLSSDGVQQVIAREAIGEDGTRYVAYANGQVECVESTSFNMAAFNGAKGL